jgi:hypothetical protein
MAKQDFLRNFRIARNLFIHPLAESDNPTIDVAAAAKKLARAAIWLTPKSVKGFNADDFPELGLDRQKELQTAVRDFSEVAKDVPADKSATAEQYGNAAVAFRKMFAILDPYLASPEEGKLVAQAIRTVELPPWVLNWDYELGSDAEGSPAVWVNFFADQSAATPTDFGRFASQMTQKIRPALSAAGVKRWPYIRVRTAAEYKSA